MRDAEMLMRKVPKGRFTLDTKSGRTNHLLVSTVTGIAPFVSYVRSLYKDWKEGRFAGEQKLFFPRAFRPERRFRFGDDRQIRQIFGKRKPADLRLKKIFRAAF